MPRIALGLSYRGSAYQGWQSQPGGRTVQDRLEAALGQFADEPLRTLCAGRTDAGVHAINQVVHFDTSRVRAEFSWLRGTNRFLPADIAVQWCRPVREDFHARNAARARRYVYMLRVSAARPALDSGLVGWTFRSLDLQRMREAAVLLIGEHDFSAFRAAECQAASPVKRMLDISIRDLGGAYWRFEFEAVAFLHHMVRNLMGSLLAVGSGNRPPEWLGEVLRSQDRRLAAPTFAPDGLYFLGPRYDAVHGLPTSSPAADWLPGSAV
ncbi:MAG: tRNA pseudouridine(38-40) synthase TruA [Pseudomonadota bacterium]|jgi:tRNA pseudouridine38-40 synthase